MMVKTGVKLRLPLTRNKNWKSKIYIKTNEQIDLKMIPYSTEGIFSINILLSVSIE